MRIVRAGRSFRMILHAEQRQRTVAHAFVRLIIQIHVSNFHVVRRKRFRVDREAVILRRDFHLPRQQILYRMVRPWWPNFSLKFFRQAQARKAGGPGKFRTPALGQSTCEYCQSHTPTGSGSPGPFERKTTVRHLIPKRPPRKFAPARRSRRSCDPPASRRIFCLMPKSYATTLPMFCFAAMALRPNPRATAKPPARSNFSSTRIRSDAVTRLASSCPAIVGNARASAINFSAGVPSVQHHCAHCASRAQVTNQRARIHIPNYGNFVALKIRLRGFLGPPIGCQS